MTCLPEKFIYGWLFSINSESESLIEYKRRCYEILYDYFHGALTGRMKILEERIDINAKIKEKQAELEKSEIYQAIEELKKKRTQAGRELNKMDKDLASGQLKFIFN